MRKKGKREKLRHVWRQLRNPPNWIAVLVVGSAFIVCPLLVLSLIFSDRDIMYVVVAWTLCVILTVYAVTVVVNGIIKLRRKALKMADRYAFTRNLFKNYEFRTLVFGVWAFLCNAGYTVFLLVMAFKYRSVWYGTIGIYYILLLIARGGVLIQNTKDERKYRYDYQKLQMEKVGTYRYCGVMMLVLSFALAVSVIELIVDASGFRHGVWLIFVHGGVSLYKIIAAIYHFVRSTKHDDLVVRSVRYINSAVTLMSILCLQTSIVAAFPPKGVGVAWVNGITGALVCAVTLALGVYMVVFSVKEKKRLLAQEVMFAEVLEGVETGYNRDGYQEEN